MMRTYFAELDTRDQVEFQSHAVLSESKVKAVAREIAAENGLEGRVIKTVDRTARTVRDRQRERDTRKLLKDAGKKVETETEVVW